MDSKILIIIILILALGWAGPLFLYSYKEYKKVTIDRSLYEVSNPSLSEPIISLGKPYVDKNGTISFINSSTLKNVYINNNTVIEEK